MATVKILLRISWLLLGSLSLLQGCTGVPSIKPVPSNASQLLNQAHLKHIANIRNFSLKGRIGVQTQGKGFSGALHWQHDAHADDIALYSPLGGQVASIKKSAEQITLNDANGKSFSSNDAETLTQSTLGWQLPLSGLADWVLGRPAGYVVQGSTLQNSTLQNSTLHNSTWDERGLLTTLNQDGWQIEFQNYSEQSDYLLPAKIVLKSEKVNLKLLVEKWGDLENLNIQN
ncbi:MAG: lipoprotein insertase outer membrane protein LolB [Methylotenera sp.]|nr:lipoprotein insertase outer membrane protein LolB [Methylotenera sp.]MDP3304394.1 lipoprotein insertase outer membrane protein LolB [Methylotenera sp.]